MQGEGPGGLHPPHPAPHLSDLTLDWDWNSYINRIIYHFLTSWFFLMKRALHFPTKLNSRDIQKCNILFLSTLLLSVRLSSQSSISRRDVTATGVHKLRNTWSSLSEVICPRQSSTVLSKPKFGPPSPLQIKNAFVHYFHINHNTPYLPPTPPPLAKNNPFWGLPRCIMGMWMQRIRP